ncbi:MAG: DUF4070 domain-containing protein [Nitrospinota bacterium]|nr:DUF4070 domain-containing protein [Nitrospinota bacterium]MDH5678858.1 DUF4070 domain-containing protein [Nitrospinota bacterium]MDH5757424.1 DUF4070 domain-containing protein [Nitrospinota bacterium]
MRLLIIYPKWRKLRRQTEFHLPPHGPVCFASALGDDVQVSFCDENVDVIDFDQGVDMVAMSVMLTCQIQRAWEIAGEFRRRGTPVIFGGIGTMLHFEETLEHADAVFLGEAETHIGHVLEDYKRGKLKKLYDMRGQLPDTSLIKPARRDILNRERYNYRGVQMVDLVHASRGCRFKCFPCSTPYLGGVNFRPRPIDQVVEELEGIENNRLFFVDNSLGQDDQWEKDLFRAITPLKKKWISHPIKDDDEILDLAAESGCWYVYQAIIDTSDHIRKRVLRLKERGIGVEGTILLGLDMHDEDYIRRLVDFLLELDLDLAEFTVLTPFLHTPIYEELRRDGRILHSDWKRYTTDEVVFQPAKMSAGKLAEMYEWAWEHFYQDKSQEIRMANLFMKVAKKEMAQGTYRLRKEGSARRWRTPA